MTKKKVSQNKKRLGRAGALLLLCLPFIVLPLFSSPTPNRFDEALGAEDWWNPDYSYRRAITISNSGSELTDYQVLLEISDGDFHSKNQSNGEDIRFVAADQVLELSFWIETWNVAGISKIWVKLPSIAGSTDTIIYLYYSNAQATSLSAGEVTFDFFDDFLGSTLNTSKWHGSGSVANSEVTTNAIQAIGFIARKGEHIVEAKAKSSDNSYGKDFGFKFLSNSDSQFTYQYHAGLNLVSTNKQEIHEYDPPYSSVASVSYVWLENTYYLFQVWKANDNTIHLYNEQYYNGINSHILSSTPNTYRDEGYIGFYESSDIDAAVTLDWFRVRHLAEIKPTLILGSEESSTEPPSTTTPPPTTTPPTTAGPSVSNPGLLWGLVGGGTATAVLLGLILFLTFTQRRPGGGKGQLERRQRKEQRRQAQAARKAAAIKAVEESVYAEREANLRKIIAKFTEISVEEMAQLLQFDNPLELKRWIMDLPESVPLKVAGNQILIAQALQSGTPEAAQAIDALVESMGRFKHPICVSCGLPLEQGTTVCPDCGTTVSHCVVCKLPISFGDAVGKCSLCEAQAHLTHFQEWVKTQGKCPSCLQELPVEGIVPVKESAEGKKEG